MGQAADPDRLRPGAAGGRAGHPHCLLAGRADDSVAVRVRRRDQWGDDLLQRRLPGRRTRRRRRGQPGPRLLPPGRQPDRGRGRRPVDRGRALPRARRGLADRRRRELPRVGLVLPPDALVGSPVRGARTDLAPPGARVPAQLGRSRAAPRGHRCRHPQQRRPDLRHRAADPGLPRSRAHGRRVRPRHVGGCPGWRDSARSSHPGSATASGWAAPSPTACCSTTSSRSASWPRRPCRPHRSSV